MESYGILLENRSLKKELLLELGLIMTIGLMYKPMIFLYNKLGGDKSRFVKI